MRAPKNASLHFIFDSGLLKLKLDLRVVHLGQWICVQFCRELSAELSELTTVGEQQQSEQQRAMNPHFIDLFPLTKLALQHAAANNANNGSSIHNGNTQNEEFADEFDDLEKEHGLFEGNFFNYSPPLTSLRVCSHTLALQAVFCQRCTCPHT